MTIREATNTDIDNILPLRLEIHQYHYRLDKVYEPVVDLAQSFAAHTLQFISDPKRIALIAIEQDKVIGLAMGKLKEPHQLFSIPKAGVIDEICVSTKHRNKGTGKQLVMELIKWFKANDAHRVELGVHDKNNSAQQFWEKLGFACFTKQLFKQVD